MFSFKKIIKISNEGVDVSKVTIENIVNKC